MEHKLQVGLVQYSPLWEDKRANKDLILTILKHQGAAELLVFPEMTLTGFSMNPGAIAEGLEGESVMFFANIAAEYSSTIIFGMVLQEEGKYFNTLVCINPQGKVETIYKKIHLFTFAQEHVHYTPGDEPAVFMLNRFRIGLSICFDLRFPELMRLYAKQQTDLIINIANWPVKRAVHWNALLKARAIENQCYICAVNRTGSDPLVEYQGDSSIFSPMGELIAHSNTENAIIKHEIHLSTLHETRERFPFLKEMKLI